MKKVGVIANPNRPHSDDIFDRLEKKANQFGWKLYADEGSAKHLKSATVIKFEEFASTIDLMLSMGGDGTVLLCAKLLGGTDIPILGINLGGLGFLTVANEYFLEKTLEEAESGICTKSARAVAECTTSNGNKYRMLNDATIGFGNSSHITKLDLKIDNELITTFACDGIILSTPTGSTGHSLSAGGPILKPGTNAFAINVICPHTLSNRPLIIPDSSVVDITIHSARKSLVLSIDGQDVEELKTDDSLHIQRSKKNATFLYPPGYNYFSVLTEKLHWRGSSV